MEQAILTVGGSVLQDYGANAVVLAALLAYAWHMKYKAVDPTKSLKSKTDDQEKEIEKLRVTKNEIYRDIHRIELNLKERVTWEWNRTELMPKIDAINQEIRSIALTNEKLSNSISFQQSAFSEMKKSLDRLTDTLDKTTERIGKVERQV